MKGRIKYFNNDKGYGFIQGENGSDYFFHISEFKTMVEPRKGMIVEYIPTTNEKGDGARNISVAKTELEHVTEPNMARNPKFITIGDLSLKLSNIKKYEIICDEYYWCPTGYRESNGKFFATYTYSHNGMFVICRKRTTPSSFAEMLAESMTVDSDVLFPYLDTWYELNEEHEDKSCVHGKQLPRNISVNYKEISTVTIRRLQIVTYQNDVYNIFETRNEIYGFNASVRTADINEVVKRLQNSL